MIPALTTHLWQSTFFALAAGMLTFAFRRNRAQVRYWLWLSASGKFFVPFAVLMSLGGLLGMRSPAAHKIATEMTTPAISYTMVQFSEPLPVEPLVSSEIHWIPLALCIAWFCGFLTITLIRFRSWLRVRGAVRASAAIDIFDDVEVRVSPGLLEPGVVGLLRPILLLPEGIAEHLTPSELKAVLAHELCHVRRRDNLFAALHMIVEAVFWFHPLVWWIGARLVEERERACDEEVLSLGNQPDVYADAILNVCKLYVESPLVCVSGVSGASIRRRVEVIMANRRLRGLSHAKKLLLATVAIAALAGPVVIGLLLGVGNMSAIHAQTMTPKFDVVAIRPCEDNHRPPGFGVTPGMLKVYCLTVAALISTAYVNHPEPGAGTLFARDAISGGPSWLNSAEYNIEAKAEGNPSGAVMGGPMLRALLGDRFRLKLHRQSKEIPVYEMTVAKSGLKLKPLPEGSCTPFDLLSPEPQGQTPDEARAAADLRCNWSGYMAIHAATLDQVANWLSHMLGVDRPVVNKTGIGGIFDVHLDITRGEPSAHVSFGDSGGELGGVRPSGDASIFTAVQEQLGLKLEAARGDGEFLVIDHVEPPSEN